MVWIPYVFYTLFSFIGMTAKVVVYGTAILTATGTALGVIAGGTAVAGGFHIYLHVKNKKGKKKGPMLLHTYSEIAATSWTSPRNWTPPANWSLSVNVTEDFRFEKSFLYYQDPDEAIIVSTRSNVDALWATVNVTDQLDRSGYLIRARSGTPLAATTSPGTPFQAVLYFVDQNNKTVEVRSADPELRLWVKTDIGDQENLVNQTGLANQTNFANQTSLENLATLANSTNLANPTMSANHTDLANQTIVANQTNLHMDYFSQMAAHWFDCLPHCENSTDGTDQVRVFFQKSNRLGAAISEPWSKINLTADMTPGSGIAVIPYIPPCGRPEMRLFFDNSTEQTMMKWKNETGWEYDEEFAGTKKPKLFLGQSIAATTFEALKPSSLPAWFILAAQLDVKGRVKATYWDPIAKKWTSNKKVKFCGGKKKPKFTRIAFDNNGTFYGARDGAVHEYNVDANKPHRFRYSSRVLLRNRVEDIDV